MKELQNKKSGWILFFTRKWFITWNFIHIIG